MFIVYVTVSFLFGWPSIDVVFAVRFATLPGPRVSLFVLPIRCQPVSSSFRRRRRIRQVTRSFKYFFTFATLLHILDGSLGRFSATGHGAHDVFVGLLTHRSLEALRTCRLRRDHGASAKGDGLPVLNSHKLHRTTILAQSSVEAKPFVTGKCQLEARSRR